MARTPRSKPDLEVNAAYAVSQPLFDALRAATASINEQRLHLTIARDLVQQLHIRAPHVNGPKDMDKYDRFLASATRAWKITTEAYSDIFEALASVTGADATTGREASRAHGRFKAMADTATNAKLVVAGYTNASSDGFTQDEKHVEDEMDGTKSSTSGRRKRAPSSGSSAPLEHRPPKVQKTVKTALIAARNEAIPVVEHADPKVEYEDVSAEVAARLKAKEEKKAAKKAAKKRKRESGDSVLTATVQAEGNPNNHIQKKARQDGVPSNEVNAAGVTVKRKKEVTMGESNGNKKRKS